MLEEKNYDQNNGNVERKILESKPKFQKLTPIRDAEIGIYRDALDYVFENNDLLNIAISGAYSAGKSSVLESYKAKHSEKRFLHISLAHFEEANDGADLQTEQRGEGQHIEVKESVLEWKILNQLIHQITASRIPQTNFRIKQKNDPKKVWLWTAGTLAFILSVLYIIFFGSWQTYIESISTTWIRDVFWLTTRNSSPILAGGVCVTLAAILVYHLTKAQVNKGIFKKISADKFEIEIFEGSVDSYFDKYLNEVLYLFNQCESDVIVFEDMDRYNANRIFERLREVNNLINTQRNKKDNAKPLRFFYLLRDDIFVSKDRTKFFDFIVPIVPVVDGSNSYDQFIKHLTDSGVWELFDEQFLQGLSLYIDDMRILKNICNEFLIYNSRLNITELNPNKLMAMIAYKNLFPRDFNDLQLNCGFVFTLFDKKDHFTVVKIAQLDSEIQVLRNRIETAKNEGLVSTQEVDFIFDDKKQKTERRYNHTRTELADIENERKRRKQAVEDNLAERISELEDEIREIEPLITQAKSESLHEIITRENIDEIFSVTSQNDIGITSDYKAVRGNTYFALLKYLIRNGYIDESYADYMTYFYEHSLSRTDKIFLRSIADQIKKEPNYQLKEPEKILARLDVTVFKQPEVLNYDLLFYLLEECASFYEKVQSNSTLITEHKDFPQFPFADKSDHKENKCLIVMIDQILAEKDYAFLQGVFLTIRDKKLNYLVNFLNAARKDCLVGILTNKSEFAGSCRDDFAFRTLIVSPEIDLTNDNNFKNALSGYISAHPDFLDKDRFDDAALQEKFGIDYMLFSVNVNFISRLKKLGVRFETIDYEKANAQLFDDVYENHLYQLTADNIAHLLTIKYGLVESDDFKHKNYTLVRISSDSPLANYIESEIDNYISVTLATCGGKITDDEAYVLDILNNKNISDEHKASYIDVLTTVIQSISDVEDSKLWKKLIASDLIAHTEKNVLDYFCAHENKITQELVQFIDEQSNEYDYTAIRNDYEDDIQSKYFNAVLRCNEMGNEHYGQILRTLERAYNNGFNVENVANDKIFILIDIGVIPMHVDSLIFMREHYPDAILPYIKKYISAYVTEILDDENFDLDEILSILSSDVVDKYKLALLEKVEDKITARNPKYSDAVKSHILQNNLYADDISHFICSYPSEGTLTKQTIEKIAIGEIDAVFESEYGIDKGLVDKLLASTATAQTIRLKLFALLLPSLDETQCKNYLAQLELNSFISLFEQKRPKIEINETNTRILDIFRNKGWITKFEEDDKEGGYYRAFGRKAHTDEKMGGESFIYI